MSNTISEIMPDLNVKVDSQWVGYIEINRPPNNFFDYDLIKGIATALAYLEEQKARAVVLSSVGKNFCAGANFSDSSAEQGNAAAAPNAARSNPLYAAATDIFERKLPIVAAVRGAAIGGGLGVAIAADFRIGGPSTRMAANFVKLGIHPGFGLTLTLPRILGHQKATELFYTGKRLSGQECADYGLLDRFVDDDQIQSCAVALATEIAQCAPLAVQSTRSTMREGLSEQVRLQTDREFLEQRWLMETEDHQEGVASVSERRPGQFTGN